MVFIWAFKPGIAESGQKIKMALSTPSAKTYERWLEYYARFGYAAKGVLYGSTGVLAILAALDFNRNETVVGSTGALRSIANQPFGRVLVILIAASLMGYVVWRFLQAFLDPEHSGCDASDIVRRIGYGCSGCVYASIAYSVVDILSEPVTDGDRSAEEWVFIIMRQPFGRWLIGAAGFGFFCIGCYYFYRAIKAEFRKRFKLHKMSDVAKRWAFIVGRVGIAARGVVYTVIGVSAMRAAWLFDADEIKTTEQALAVFNDNPANEIVLLTLGVGFVAYAIHMAFQARYRTIDPL
ncbi:MAG: DUF1206 domain-containing protein [Saprospiraceae bacterium]